MDIVEIVLLIAGGIIFILSFLIPDKKPAQAGGGEDAEILAGEETKKLVARELEAIREHVDDVVGEAVTYAIEKTERSLERLSNEKIMAVSEYSDTVLAEIHKNHEEAMFLYDMLNNKHINLKNTVTEVNRTVKQAEEAVSNIQRLAPEALSGLQKPAPEAVTDLLGLAPENASPERQETEVISGLQRLAAGRNSRSVFPGAESEGGSGFRKLAPETLAAAQNQTVSSPGEAAGREPQKWMPERIAPAQSEPGATASAAVSSAQNSDEQGRNNNERILELYRQGKSRVSIAKELGLGVGEVKLVIDLFENP